MTFKKKTKRIYRLPVGEGGPSGLFAPLRQIHHVSHLQSAKRILKKGRIRSSEVDDGSRLDDHDVSVCWLAPNCWEESLFGTVQFTFDLEDILAGRRMYWVEGVDRELPTCRLLLTDRDVSDLPVQPYDPERTEGPIRLFEGDWFWKSDVHVELMIEGDLPLTHCRAVSAVGHRRDRCRRKCGEVGRSASDTAARILADLMGGRFGLPTGSYVNNGRASALIQDGWFGLLQGLDLLDGEIRGKIKGRTRVDETVHKALSRLAKGDARAAAERVAKVAGDDRIRSSLRRLLQRGAGIRLGHPRDTVINLASASEKSAVATRRAGGRSTRSAPGRAGESAAAKQRRGVVR